MSLLCFRCIRLPNCCLSPHLCLPVSASMQLFRILLSALIAASPADGLFFVCLYISHILWTQSTHVVLDSMSPHFYFFFLCPTSSFCSFPFFSPSCPDLEMLRASANDGAY
ncbi:hypothetical protein XENORESO_003195 [Xenotaenia resolanae]|uniref:Uncharacterized protein n=1 Tax=Xenotaenia resolanae TaxID=208358 RepID=A0ABV0W3A4_9TELE